MDNLTRSVLRKTYRMKWRIVGISLVVSWAMAMLVMGLYTADVFDNSIETFIDETNFPDLFVDLSEPVPVDNVTRALSYVPGIADHAERLKASGTYEYNGRAYPAIVIGMDDPEPSIARYEMKTGRVFAGGYEAIVVSGMDKIRASAGNSGLFTVQGHAFSLNITGTMQTPEYLFLPAVQESSLPLPGELVVAYMDLASLQKILGGGVNQILLTLKDKGYMEPILDGLAGLPVMKVTSQKDHDSVKFMGIGAGKMRNMFPMLSMIFMMVGLISIFMTAYRVVQADSRYIGVMMSLGNSRGRIILAYLTLGIVIAVIGIIAGLVMAVLFTWGIMTISMQMIGDIRISYPIAPGPFLIGIGYAFVAVLVSVAIPTLMITRRTVRESLDYKPKVRVTRVRAGGSILPKMATIGVRNAFRNPIRTALTILAVSMTIGIAGSWMITIGSSVDYLNEQLEQDVWDLRVDYASPRTVNRTLVPDAQWSVPFAFVAGQAVHEGSDTGAFVFASDDIAKAKDLKFREGKPDPTGAIVTNKLADEIDVGAGDRIRIVVGGSSMEIIVKGVVYDMFLQAIYLDRTAASPLVPPTVSNGEFVKMKIGSDIPAKADELMFDRNVSRVTVQKDLVEYVQTFFGSAMDMLYFFFGIGLLIAFIVSSSAVIISTMERDLEFATLSSLGISKLSVARSIIIEVAIIGAISAIIAIPWAYAFANLAVQLIKEVVYYFPILFIMSATIMTAVFGFAFVLLSSGVPIRYHSKLDVEKTIRERTAG